MMIKCLATDQVWHVVKRQLLVVILINIQLAWLSLSASQQHRLHSLWPDVFKCYYEHIVTLNGKTAKPFYISVVQIWSSMITLLSHRYTKYSHCIIKGHLVRALDNTWQSNHACDSLSHIVFIYIDIDILLYLVFTVSSKVIKIKILCNYAVPEWRYRAWFIIWSWHTIKTILIGNCWQHHCEVIAIPHSVTFAVAAPWCS